MVLPEVICSYLKADSELGQTPGDSGGQGGLVCRSPWGYKELDMT